MPPIFNRKFLVFTGGWAFVMRTFDFNEEVLAIGAAVQAQAVVDYLEE